MNHLGYYNGGLPQKGLGNAKRRGKALESPGKYHSPAVHNYYENQHLDSHVVDIEEAESFRNWMQSDKFQFNLSRPYYKTYFDKDMEYMKDRNFWLALLGLTIGFIYAENKWYVESMRHHEGERKNIENMPAHHFVNRGGVLLKKEFVGFEKYYKNDEALMNWYKKAYPSIYHELEQE